MYKLIDSSSFFDQEDLQVTVLNAPGSLDSLVKCAADDRVQSFVLESLKPEPGKMYLHINAMGAGEYYGPNRNCDYFPEENLKRYFKTFETSPAHVFRHHINKDPARAIGRVIFALYNERMHRVELVAEVDRNLGSDVEQRIAQGDFPATSMACKTPYDVCSVCGNKAHTRQEYCIHLKQQLGKILPDGRRVMALNEGPLRFFDISIVIKPADVTSSILQKVASEAPVSSALLAEEEGLSFDENREKKAALGKVSELIKEIDGYVESSDPSLENLLERIEDPSLQEIKKLDSVPIEDLLHTFGELGISPSLKYLSEIIAHRMGHSTSGIGNKVLSALKDSALAELKTPSPDIDTSREVNPLVKKALFRYQEASSLFPEFIEKRAYAVRGYAANGPKILPTREEEMEAARRAQGSSGLDAGPSLAVLLTIGGAALWAKAYINSIIEQKMEKIHPEAKSLIVKMASTSAAKEIFEGRRASEYSPGVKALTKTLSATGIPTARKISTAITAVSVAQNKIPGKSS